MKRTITKYLLDHCKIDIDHEFVLMELDLLKRNAMGKYISDEKVQFYIDSLVREWNNHVRYEEYLMLAQGYEHVDSHKASHKLISVFITCMVADPSVQNIDNCINDILSHIDVHDRLLVDFLKGS